MGKEVANNVKHAERLLRDSKAQLPGTAAFAIFIATAEHRRLRILKMLGVE